MISTILDFSGLQQAANKLCETVDRLRAEKAEMLAALHFARTALDHDNATQDEMAAYDMVCAAIEKVEGNT